LGHVRETRISSCPHRGPANETPISLFAQTQGETFIDHDFTEGAYVGDTGTWIDRVGDHSWSEFWADEVLNLAKGAGFENPNAFFMCGDGRESDGNAVRTIAHPQNIDQDGVTMTYVGQVTHRIE